MSPKARQSKSKARITAYEKLLSKESASQSSELTIFIPPGPRLGKLVIEADKVSKAYGDRILFEDMSFALPAGGATVAAM